MRSEIPILRSVLQSPDFPKECFLYTSVFKVPLKYQEWILHLKTEKKNIHINTDWEWVIFEITWKFTVSNKYMNYVIFYLHVTHYVYNTRFQFKNYWVLTVYQITIHNKCSRRPPPLSMLAGIRLITDCRVLSKVRWGVTNGWTGIKKCAGKVFLFFKKWSRILWGFDLYPQAKVLRSEVGRIWGLYLELCLRTYNDIPCKAFSSLVLGIHFWNMSKNFKYIL